MLEIEISGFLPTGVRQVFMEEIPRFSHGDFLTEKWAFQNPGIYLRWLFEKSDALPLPTLSLGALPTQPAI